MEKLTQADVKRLVSDRSADARVETTIKIAQHFGGALLTKSERAIAEEIFRLLVKDAEARVREALSDHLKACPDLPHDVALALANDIDSVSLPMIRVSDVLTDADLIGIVRRHGPAKQEAVAQRAVVSAGVADALIDSGNEQAVARLVANEGAELTTGSLRRVMTDYQGSEVVSEGINGRANLPADISERLIGELTQRLEDFLTQTSSADPDLLSRLVLQARERANLSLVQEGSSDEQLGGFVAQLHRRRALTPSLVLRALCTGDLGFVERAIAVLAGITHENARTLIHDDGQLGLESIYMRIGFPEHFFPVFRAAVDLLRETEYDGGTNDHRRFVERLTERLLTRLEDPSQPAAGSEIEYLINKLTQIAA